MKKVPFATSCPVCRVEVGSHDKPTWAVPAWPAKLAAVKTGRPVNHDRPEKWAIKPQRCSDCETTLVGEAVIIRRLYQDIPEDDEPPKYRSVHVFGGVRVRINE